MRIYTKCPCCQKTIFLVMEMELGSNYGLNHQQAKSNDWNCLNNFLNCLQTSQGNQIYLGINEKEEAKIPKKHQELILKWKEGYKKPEKENNPETEIKPKKERKIINDEPEMKRDWRNIHLDFNYQGQNWETNYQKQWEDNGFTYHQAKGWIDVGMKPSDSVFCAWLRDEKQKDPEWVLNYGNLAELRKEFENSFTHYKI